MSEPAQFLQQVVSPVVSRAYRGGLDQAEGFVVDAVTVSFADTAEEVIEAFGASSVRASLVNADASVDVLRIPVSPFHRLSAAVAPNLAGPGERGLVEPAPFTGTGFTDCQREPVALWRLGRSRLPVGAELWRVAADGGERLLDAYQGVARGWGGGPAGAFPSHLLGPKTEWAGGEWLADFGADGKSVILAALGRQPPDGFDQVREFVAERIVSTSELETIVDTTLSCSWNGAPFEIVNNTGGHASLTYTGGDFRLAQRMGLNYAQPSVYETTVATDQLEQVTGAQRTLPIANT